MKNVAVIACVFLASCSYFSSGVGQVVYHWERTNTGVERFSKDHNECIQAAKAIQFMPDFRSWFYTEETKLNTRADWNADRGIWATYIPYEGAQPLIVNAKVDDKDVDPGKYSDCMKSKGYWYRTHDIPEITNVNLYRARKPYLTHPFSRPPYYSD
jgi:hypothetical protein